MNEDTRNTIRPAMHALEYACGSLGNNVVAKRLEAHIEDIQPIVAHIREKLRQTSFINLTHKYDEGRVVVPLYAGDGIVTKIIPPDFFDPSEPVLQMPAITSDTVDTGHNKFLINTYPWVPPAPLTQETVDRMQAVIEQLGMSFTSGDNHPGNIHNLPDARKTLAGIDSCMFIVSPDTLGDDPALKEAWWDYIEALYPIYKDEAVPVQTDDTDFRFISIHDPEAGLATFDPMQETPIILHEPESRKKPGWKSMFGFSDNDGVEPI